MRRTVRCDPGRLFRVETNRGFAWHPTAPSPALVAAARGFGHQPPGEVFVLSKPSPTSALYRFASGGRRLILRSVDCAYRDSTELQCRAVTAIAYPNVIKPLLSGRGSYTVEAGGRAWMAYPEQPGEVFPGRGGRAEVVIAEAVRLENELARVAPQLGDCRRLPVVHHRPERWPRFFRELTGTDRYAALLRTHLSPDSRAVLQADRDAITGWADDLVALPVAAGRRLTHNDLQHANVLVSERGPIFLDLEDVCFESPEVALGHAIFKLLRHTVYIGDQRLEKACALVPPVLRGLRDTGFAIGDAADLFAYGAYRILSDIWEIVALSVEHGDDSALYDLEKRIHNLFELHFLLEDAWTCN